MFLVDGIVTGDMICLQFATLNPAPRQNNLYHFWENKINPDRLKELPHLGTSQVQSVYIKWQYNNMMYFMIITLLTK